MNHQNDFLGFEILKKSEKIRTKTGNTGTTNEFFTVKEREESPKNGGGKEGGRVKVSDTELY